MKITYEFDTEKDDIDIINCFLAGHNAVKCLVDLRDKIKGLIKYSDKEAITVDEIDNKFWEVINEHSINFSEMGY